MPIKLVKDRPEQDSNDDLYDASAVLYQASYWSNWEVVLMWVNEKTVDSVYMQSNK